MSSLQQHEQQQQQQEEDAEESTPILIGAHPASVDQQQWASAEQQQHCWPRSFETAANWRARDPVVAGSFSGEAVGSCVASRVAQFRVCVLSSRRHHSTPLQAA
jgi:hypothetical protein